MTARSEQDPVAREWLLIQLGAVVRPGTQWSAGLHVADRRVTVFPAPGQVDSAVYGGRSRDLLLSVQRRWRRTASFGLRVLQRYGDHQYHSEDMRLRWSGYLPPGWSVTLRAGHSWSPWRRLGRLGLQWDARQGYRWSLAAGATAIMFRWENSRRPQWRTRARPRLALRWAVSRAWTCELELEETVDEFQNLRTRAAATVSFQW